VLAQYEVVHVTQLIGVPNLRWIQSKRQFQTLAA